MTQNELVDKVKEYRLKIRGQEENHNKEMDRLYKELSELQQQCTHVDAQGNLTLISSASKTCPTCYGWVSIKRSL